VQVSQGPPAGHCTSVVDRPSEVNSGALPPQAESPDIRAMEKNIRNTVIRREDADTCESFMG
jgi:hypothetical protein